MWAKETEQQRFLCLGMNGVIHCTEKSKQMTVHSHGLMIASMTLNAFEIVWDWDSRLGLYERRFVPVIRPGKIICLLKVFAMICFITEWANYNRWVLLCGGFFSAESYEILQKKLFSTMHNVAKYELSSLLKNFTAEMNPKCQELDPAPYHL